MGLLYLRLLTQEPKNRGQIGEMKKWRFCVYDVFRSCEYLDPNSNIDPVQRLSDPFMRIFAHGKTVIFTDYQRLTTHFFGVYQRLMTFYQRLTTLCTRFHNLLIVNDLQTKCKKKQKKVSIVLTSSE